MKKVIVVGGGVAGCAAAITARKAGLDVTLVERTDMLMGAALRAGRMYMNGRIVAEEECKALGGNEMFETLESIILHRGNIVNEEHAYIYNTAICDAKVREMLEKAGVKVICQRRAIDVRQEKGRILSVMLNNGEELEGDAFVDTSGSSGGVPICTRYGKGCVMCVCFRCPSFGDRVSIATKAGAKTFIRVRPDGTPGAIGAAVGIYKASLSRELKDMLKEKGALTIPLPKELINYDKLRLVSANRTKEQMENINLVDIGPTAKCVGLAFFPLENLRKIKGLESAQIEDPLGGSVFNKVGFVDMSPTHETLQIVDFKNLFAAGEKAGSGGVTEAIFMGHLAGHNAARTALGKDLLVLPRSIIIGDYIAMMSEKSMTEEKMTQGLSCAHGLFFERMKERGVYTVNIKEIQKRVENAGMKDIYSHL